MNVLMPTAEWSRSGESKEVKAVKMVKMVTALADVPFPPSARTPDAPIGCNTL